MHAPGRLTDGKQPARIDAMGMSVERTTNFSVAVMNSLPAPLGSRVAK